MARRTPSPLPVATGGRSPTIRAVCKAFTAPFRTGKIANREMGTITAMTDRQEVRVRTDSGKTVKFSVDSKAHGPRAHRHLDHGYAVTSYSSQGLTADRVLLYIDSEQAGERLVNQRLAYVALSRGRHDAQIYTDDRERLSTALSRDVSKASAHAVRSAEQTAQQDRSPSPHSALRHATTIAAMTPTSVGREGTLADAKPHSTTLHLSTEELQRAREYLARSETQQYLRAREVLYTRTQQPRPPVAIEARLSTSHRNRIQGTSRRTRLAIRSDASDHDACAVDKARHGSRRRGSQW
jgi:Viral (Superfamily 1) RNA helicase